MVSGQGDSSDELQRQENVKHLELIQAVISRMASSSFFIKGWALTVAAATLGFAANKFDWRIATVGVVVLIGFWMLDALYLRQERLYRMLYDRVRINANPGPQERFAMSTVDFIGAPSVRFFAVTVSVTLRIFYGAILLAGTILALLFFFSTSA